MRLRWKCFALVAVAAGSCGAASAQMSLTLPIACELGRTCETLVYIGTASPTLTGSDSADSILGNQTATTADVINGGGGNDFIAAFAGNDIITGGIGNGYMLGGTGADAFQFGASFGLDIIGDFTVGQDIVQFTGFATRQDVLNSSLAVDADGDGAVDDTLIFQDGANAVVLVNVLKASLTAAEVGTI